MSVERARAVVPDALSFPRAAMRALVRGRYRVEKLRFELDADGRGEILYRLLGDGHVFHFFLVSDMLPEEKKTDRNFAASWDAMGVLCQGEWTAEREALLRREVPKQRAGFVEYGTLMYARGNRSARIFNHVVDSLAQGRQPDLAELAPVGYILRTTAFIGNGQHGTLPLDAYGDDHPLRRPYHAQFCSGFMLREYVFDLVDHLARVRSANAVRLAPEYRRFLGLGNSAATGLAAYATNHPQQMHRWSLVHEEALVEAMRRTPVLTGALAEKFTALLHKAIAHFTEGAHPSDGVFAAPQDTAGELRQVEKAMQSPAIGAFSGGDEKSISVMPLVQWARANVSIEACEVLHALLLELHPEIAEAAVDNFLVDEETPLHPESTVADLIGLIDRQFGWALAASHDDADAPVHFWYRSSSAPRDVRRGLRRRLEQLEFETNMDFVLQLREAHRLLRTLAPDRSIGSVLCERPDLRHAVARAQSLADARYGSLRQHWLSARYTPFEAIRFVLAFFGMEKFEAAFPKSVRGTFMQGAPIAEDVAAGRDGRWPFTLMPTADRADAHDVLAPLPPTAGRVTPVTVTHEAVEPQVLLLAPKELARAVQVALQGHGMPLGVAIEAGAMVAFEQHRSNGALATALRHCAEKRIARFQVPRGAQNWPEGDRPLTLEAGDASALAVAPAALDLALARGMRVASGRAAVLVASAQDASLVRSIVLRGARKGMVTAFLWRGRDATGAPACGYGLAGPQQGGNWYAEGSLAGDGSSFVEQLVFCSAGWQVPQFEGFLVACIRPGPDLAPVGLQVRTDAQLAADAARSGVALQRADYDALLQAGRALLVPQAVEHLVLQEGFDPLKSF